MSTLQAPAIYLAGGQSGNPAGQNNLGQLEMAYQNLLSAAADVVDGVGPAVLVLSSAAITSAASFEVDLNETAAEVASNRSILSDIATFCRLNNISVMVEANLTNAPTWSEGAGQGHNQLVDQWAQVAAEVGLPITKVEDVQEIATAYPQSTFADYAAIEANAVRTLIQDYASSSYTMTAGNLAVGDMEGGPPDMNMAMLSAYWDAYDAAATAIGMPNFSFTTTDAGWFAPWLTPLSAPSWQNYLEGVSTAAAAHNMTLNVLIQGAETSTSANQFVQQAEQNAACLATLAASGAVTVGSIMIQSWDPQPVSVDMITSPTSSVNEAAEIKAVYPLYAAGSITAEGSVSVSAPGQILLNTGSTQSITPVVVNWDAADVLAGNRLGIVIIDQTGTLRSKQHGSGTVSNIADNILILSGNAADLAAELSAITLTEPDGGADTIDIEVYGAEGRIYDIQVSVLAAAIGQTVDSISTSNRSQGWLTTTAILNTGSVITSASKLISETLTWSTTGVLADSITGNPIPGKSAFVQTVSIHEPLAEYGVKNASGVALGVAWHAVADIFDPNVDNGASPANGYANNLGVNNVSLGPLSNWLTASFDPVAQLTPLLVQSTTKTFDPDSGQLEEIVRKLAPDPLTVVDKTGTHRDTFAKAFDNGGIQVVELNTGSNAAWMLGWGSQFASATLTYDGDGRLVELFLQGGPANPLFTIDYVFDPSNGQLWEEFQSTTPPPKSSNSNNYANTTNPYQPGFVTGPLYVTEFNTGDNPNWNYLDWGSSLASDTEVWTDNFIMANFSGFAENFTGQNAGALSAYPYEFVNGSTLDLMYLPGTIIVDLNELSTLTLASQTVASGLSGLNAIDAAGATGGVNITGLRAGGSTLIGGDSDSTITGFGHDKIVAGAGRTIINAGGGGSAIDVSSITSGVTVSGNNNAVTAVADSTLIVTGEGNTLTVGRGSTVTLTGTGDAVTYLDGGTLSQNGATSSASVTGDRVAVWMSATGGSVQITGHDNRVTGGNAAAISLIGNNNVAGARAGSTISVNGLNNIVSGSQIAVAVATAATTLSVIGNNDTVTAASGSAVTVNGTDDTVNGSGVIIYTSTSTRNIDISGDNEVVNAANGTTLGITGQGEMVMGSNLTIYLKNASSITVSGSNNTIHLGVGSSAVHLDSANQTVFGGTGNGSFYVNAVSIAASITGGSGTNAMHAQDGGNFTMSSRITHMQTVYLDDVATGFNFVANATAGLVIQAGKGNDIVSVGASSQSVLGGDGSLRVLATAANAGAMVRGGGIGGAILEITSGGTVSLNNSDTNLTVILDAQTQLNLGELSFITAVGAAVGHDTMTAGGQNQTLQSIGGNDTLIGSSAGGVTFRGSVAGLTGDMIRHFVGSDMIDITDLSFATLKPLLFDAASGILTATDATQNIALTMAGDFGSAHFVAADDGHGGSQIRLSGS